MLVTLIGGEGISASLSVCVVSYNHAKMIGTLLRGLGFADEVVVVDKSSTDGTAEIARRYADRVLTVPWSPTVEETRRQAVAVCSHDWILLLDDDELLTTASGPWIRAELQAPRADIYNIPRRDYILGIHDERAYYWPEVHPRLFRRDAVELVNRVHAGLNLLSDRRYTIPLETGVCLHHLSHTDAAQWFEKTNRYTSRPDRVRMDDGSLDLQAFAHEAIDRWYARGRPGRGDYPAAVALARATYDMIDRLKGWEAENAAGGAARFDEICRTFDAAYAAAGLVRERGASFEDLLPPADVSPVDPIADAEMEGLRAALRHLRVVTDTHIASAHASGESSEAAFGVERERLAANSALVVERARQKAAKQIGAVEQALVIVSLRADQAEHRAETSEQLVITINERLAGIKSSTVWRATRPLRQAGTRFPIAARTLRRVGKLLWWTVTLQLPRRYALRRQARLAVQPADFTAALPAHGFVAATGPFRLPCSTSPLVSIIISTYGQKDVTVCCLRSISEHQPHCPIEVIVVDDAYPDPSEMQDLQDIEGLQYSRNSANLGFLRSSNQAARRAKGRYIYMLNNDTELRPGAIDTLVELLEARPDVGMAGSKLLFPNGRLQEAGGIIWTDASGWNYGRGDDPSRPEYNYTREVDYCSGAAILIRRSLFETLSGFDEAFVPAYYEDVDLAFRIREHGFKVVYEPRSEVVHYEGMSHGTDTAAGVKASQITNQARMLERWSTTLAGDHYNNGAGGLRARDRARNRKVILVIDHYVPEPDRDAGSRSVGGIIDGLLDAGWVVKFWPHNRVYNPTYTNLLERRGIEVVDQRRPGDLNTWMRECGKELDHLLVIRPSIAVDVLPQLMWNTDAVLSFYGVDLHFARMRRHADQDGSPGLLLEALRMEQVERRIWRHFDVVIYPSEEEAAVVRAMAPGTRACGIVPFCFDASPARLKPPQEHSILFVGGFAHAPNVDAALFLINEILPRLIKAIGPVKVVLAGSNPSDAVRALASQDVEVTGYVTDEELAALYERHRVAVVPLRFGAGVKGKVVEALSQGLPLVTTSTGAQGIVGLAEVVPVHDDAEAIVAALKRLMTEDGAWIAQSAAQVAFAQRFFSSAAMKQSVLAALESGEVALGRAKATGA